MSKRAKRRFDRENKYKKRLKEWLEFYRTPRDRPDSWKELRKTHWSKFLRDTPTPCSCEMCSGEYKYKRHKKRQEDNRCIREEMDYMNDIMDDFDLMKITDFNRYNNKV